MRQDGESRHVRHIRELYEIARANCQPEGVLPPLIGDEYTPDIQGMSKEAVMVEARRWQAILKDRSVATREDNELMIEWAQRHDYFSAALQIATAWAVAADIYDDAQNERRKKEEEALSVRAELSVALTVVELAESGKWEQAIAGVSRLRSRQWAEMARLVKQFGRDSNFCRKDSMQAKQARREAVARAPDFIRALFREKWLSQENAATVGRSNLSAEQTLDLLRAISGVEKPTNPHHRKRFRRELWRVIHSMIGRED